MKFDRCAVHNLEIVPFEQARALQETLADEIRAGLRPPTLLLLEHPHTYTFGRRGQAENLLWDAEELARRGITVCWTDRGGDVTYHGPGQLVGYPLLPLAPVDVGLSTDPASGGARLPQADYVGYLRRLELALITALAHLGQPSFQLPGLTGIWIDSTTGEVPSKIAALGVKVDARGISRHGFALNVAPDMSFWEGIIGCGLQDYPVTSLTELQPDAPIMEVVREAVASAFCDIFTCELIIGASLEKYLH
jgi:lipoate-protein ligase B